MKELELVVKIAGELCDSVDAADEDVGGCRRPDVILKELGPAVDEAMKLLGVKPYGNRTIQSLGQ